MALDPPPVAPDALDAPPSPALFPELYDSVSLGAFSFPPVPGQDGVARIEFGSSIKLDKQTAKGKNKAKTKVNGVEALKGKLTIEWTAAIWDAAVQFTMAIDPNGPNAGKPFEITHPEAKRRRVASIIVEKGGKLEIKPGGEHYVQSFEIEEWVDPATADADTDTKETPDDAAQWTASYGGKTPGAATSPAATPGTSVWKSSRGPSAAP